MKDISDQGKERPTDREIQTQSENRSFTGEMSVQDRAAAALLTQIALTADGALFGLGLAYVAYRSTRRYIATSSAIRKIRQAPAVQPSDLRSILPHDSDCEKSHLEERNGANSDSDGSDLVIVRGTVEVKSAVEKGSWRSLLDGNLVVSQESGEVGVILQRTQRCIYNEWRGLFGWTADLRSMLSKSWKDQESTSTRMVPFILVEDAKRPQSGHVVVNMEGSSHPLPLTTVYQHLQPTNSSPFIFLQALFGIDYPVGLLYEEKILPLGKDITAVGFCKFKNGIPEIKSCSSLPYFLSDLTKDQILADLSFKAKVLQWSGIIFGSVAVTLLGYSVARNWMRWKERRRRQQRSNPTPTDDQAPAESLSDEEAGDIPDGQLCVICLTRRRRSAFIPCGHLVCCPGCALEVGVEVSPKCPVCRQSVRNSVRIYDS
ncbi:E3 ubiquitin-protein ligase SPL2 isoform X3 [Andrographis paniculata]|uniref:E3 ubiquitin-protein ligase SPL2 isoform X3 n=1 Tax=Andrographis paniculata TaxID=175694 RepID=UPI0021E7CD79|nr:E3 ubiquitin-protein ligase SPL2 isoform X3 [Andrographis paniculata]